MKFSSIAWAWVKVRTIEPRTFLVGCLCQLAKEQWYLDEALWNNQIIVAGGLSIKDLAKLHCNTKRIYVPRFFYLRSLKKINTTLQGKSSGTKHKQKKRFKSKKKAQTVLILQQNWQIKLYSTHSKKSRHWRIAALSCASFQDSKINLLSPHPSSSPPAAWLYIVWDLPLCSHSLVPLDCDLLLTQQNRHLKNNTVHFRVVSFIAHWL